jgi:glucoamylase
VIARPDLRGGDCPHAHDSVELAVFLEEFADWIEKASRRLDRDQQRRAASGVIKRTTCAFVRRKWAKRMRARAAGSETIRLQNRPPGTRTEFEAREIIDAGFLELVRYGVRRRTIR